MALLPEFVMCLLDKIVAEEGLLDHRIELQAGCKHGDGFIGIMVSVNILGYQHIDGVKKPHLLHLLCKIPPDNSNRRREFYSAVAFDREARAYNEIIPFFGDFQREKGISNEEAFNAHAKCYAAIADVAKDEYAVIMEDLRARKFVLFPKEQPAKMGNSILVFEQLAKFHAVSFALKDQRADVYDNFRAYDDILLRFIRTGNSAVQMFLSAVRYAMTTLKSARHLKMLQSIHDNFHEILEKCLGVGVAEPYSVLGHGDCWNNNILFKMISEQNSIADDVCFIDWQLLRFGSPVIDLHYNFFGSSDRELRQKERKRIFNHYYSTLSEQIRRMGSDPDELFPRSAFEAHLKRFAPFTFAMAPLMVQLLLANSTDIPDMNEVSIRMAEGDNDGIAFVSGKDEETKSAYAKRLGELFDDLIVMGYHYISE